MSATIVKIAILTALCLVPLAASAQDPGQAKSERAMPDSKGSPPATKSERALPDQAKDAAATPPAAERAMPSPEKK